MTEQLSLKEYEESVYDWIEYTGCRFCNHLIAVKWPDRLFGESIKCPKCGRQFIVTSAVLADRDDFEKQYPISPAIATGDGKSGL